MGLFLRLALKHLFARRRQSIVSLLGITLGAAFFLAISALMSGSEKDFVRRLVDNSPHITIVDDFRNPKRQPVEDLYAGGAVELRNVKPLTETRGIRGFDRILAALELQPGLRAAPVLAGQAVVSFAGRDFAITINGMNPEDIKGITTIEEYMKEGSIDDLIADPDGIVIGTELARKLSLSRGDNINVAAVTGQVRTFKILGLFRTGRSDYDEKQAFASLKRIQALLDRADRANEIIIKLDDPMLAHGVAARIEQRFGYKSVSWQEMSEDILSSLTIRNIIMYTVVSAVLVVAAFGIYNVISIVVIEKHKDIAILKSMGFQSSDVQKIFVMQGVILGTLGCISGLLLGCVFMLSLMQVELQVPGTLDPIQLPVDWAWHQFVIAGSFAMVAAIAAAWLPARRASRVHPVDILRGGT